MPYWRVQIWILGPSWENTEGYWTTACIVFQAEMLGIVERALEASGQKVRSIKEQ